MALPRLTTNFAIVGSGIALAAVFIGYGSYQLARSVPAAVEMAAPVESSKSMPSTAFIVTKMGVGRGQVVTRESLDTLIVVGGAPDGATTTMDAVVGKIAIADIPAHQLVLTSLVSADPAKAGLSFTIKPGFRAIAIRTNDEIAVANFIRPKDVVDISLVLHATALPKQTEAQQIASGDPSESHTVLQGLEVLAVGETLEDSAFAQKPEAGQAARRPEPPKSITVAMTPDQISQFVLARSIGSFYLTLRNPADGGTIVSDPAALMDIRGRTPPPTGAVAQAERPIELITGSTSKTIYSTSKVAK